RAFVLDPKVIETVARGDSLDPEQRRPPLTESYGMLAAAKRKPSVIAPHRPALLAQQRLRFRRRQRGVPNEIGSSADLADAGETVRVARANGVARRTLQGPGCHARWCNRSRIRSASLVENPGNVAISAGVAVRTPASEPKRS